MILVIGGRSKIGRALIDELLAYGQDVRALAREAEASGFFPPEAEVVRGDLADVGSLRSAFDGADRLFLLCSPTEREVELNRNAVHVARDSGVRLLVRSSILGADPESPVRFLRDHGVCDRYLARSGIAHAILRPNLFMQNIVENTIPSIDPEGNFYASVGPARISMVDTRDVAAVAASLLLEPGRASQACDLTGPEALSYDDVAAKVSQRLGRTVRYVPVSDGVICSALAKAEVPDWLAGGLVELYADYRSSATDGYAARVTDSVRELAGRPARTLDELLAEPTPAGGVAEREPARQE